MACVYSTPLAMPVLPLVNRIAASESEAITRPLTGSARLLNSAVDVVQKNFHSPAFTVVRTLRFAQPNSRRAKCAFAEPMNASGSAWAKQTPRFFIPMPGSMSTGTAPILNSANVSEKKSNPGGTISATRVPASIPTDCRPLASASESACSSAKVIARCRVGPVRFTGPMGMCNATCAGCVRARSAKCSATVRLMCALGMRRWRRSPRRRRLPAGSARSRATSAFPRAGTSAATRAGSARRRRNPSCPRVATSAPR